jgi:hypothetical protein
MLPERPFTSSAESRSRGSAKEATPETITSARTTSTGRNNPVFLFMVTSSKEIGYHYHSSGVLLKCVSDVKKCKRDDGREEVSGKN